MISKEEFQTGIKEMIEESRDPNSELAAIRGGFKELADEVRVHDAVMATKVMAISEAIDDMVAYARIRAEGD